MSEEGNQHDTGLNVSEPTAVWIYQLLKQQAAAGKQLILSMFVIIVPGISYWSSIHNETRLQTRSHRSVAIKADVTRLQTRSHRSEAIRLISQG